MNVARLTVLLTICFALTGCELFNLLPRSKLSKTDVVSAHKGGPSAEELISFFSVTLRGEAEGEPCPPAWGTYEKFWKSRMEYIATHESKEYYDRVFRDFEAARARLGMSNIPVPAYEFFSKSD
jgi:hypothetical protein